MKEFETLGSLIGEAYKKRDVDPKFIEQAIIGCKKQIALSSKMLAAFAKAKQDYEEGLEKAGLSIDADVRKEKSALLAQWHGQWKKTIETMDFNSPDKSQDNENEEVMRRIKALGELDDLHFLAEGGCHYRHAGFTQLCILEEKAGNYKELLELATQAKKEGWYGDWDKRIEKAKKKLEQG